MEVGEIFKEVVRILRGFDDDGNPIVEDGIIKWEVIEVHHIGRYFIGRNKDGEIKGFPLK